MADKDLYDDDVRDKLGGGEKTLKLNPKSVTSQGDCFVIGFQENIIIKYDGMQVSRCCYKFIERCIDCWTCRHIHCISFKFKIEDICLSGSRQISATVFNGQVPK